MLRINLLPPYIYDKQKKLPFIVGSLLLIPITLALLFFMFTAANAALEAANKRKSDALTQQEQYNKYVQDGKKEDDAVAATKAKQTFIASAIKYNEAWPEVYTSMRDVTSPKVLLKTMYIGDDHKTINFTGFCENEEDLVRWWMFLREQKNMYTDVHFRLPEHPWPPKAENTGGGGGGAAMSMMGGGMPGMSGGMPGMGGSGGAPTALGNRRGAMMGGSAGPGTFGGSGGGNSDAIGPEEIEGRKGIKFSAFATLKQALANGIPTPTWATGGAAAGGGGPTSMPSGMGGMMGGSGGMMGGSGGGTTRGKGLE